MSARTILFLVLITLVALIVAGLYWPTPVQKAPTVTLKPAPVISGLRTAVPTTVVVTPVITSDRVDSVIHSTNTIYVGERVDLSQISSDIKSLRIYVNDDITKPVLWEIPVIDAKNFDVRAENVVTYYGRYYIVGVDGVRGDPFYIIIQQR